MKEVCFKIDGEWFTNFIRNMYYYDDIEYDECRDKLISCLSLHDISEEEQIELFDSIIKGGKKFVGTNELELVIDKEFNIYKYIGICNPRHFEEDFGVMGILTSEGIFAECDYKGHWATIDKLREGKQNCKGAITFSLGCARRNLINGLKSVQSFVFLDRFDRAISEAQIEWYENNKQFLNNDQRKEFERLLRRQERRELKEKQNNDIL